MSCCNKVKNIVTGYVKYATGRKSKFTPDRIRTCHKCNEQTWMSTVEYVSWLTKNGIKVLKNFTELEKLSKLPKQEQTKGRRNLYCRLCKCFLPGKARVEDMKCPLGKWQRENKGDKNDSSILDK